MDELKHFPVKIFKNNGCSNGTKLEEVDGDLTTLHIFHRVIKKTYMKSQGGSVNFSKNTQVFLNSCKYLLFLQDYNIVPKIYYIDYPEQCIYMQYCGQSLNNDNKPKNWK